MTLRIHCLKLLSSPFNIALCKRCSIAINFWLTSGVARTANRICGAIHKLLSISFLPRREQRAWAAGSRYPAGSPRALLAASVLAEWPAELADTVAAIIDQPWPKGIVESGCDPPSDTHEPFGYVDIFAGASAWSEGVAPFGGFPVGPIEIDTANQKLLEQFYPHAWVCGDYYAEEWQQHPSDKTDVVVAWPMCKHLSRAGLRRMQTDDCAS